MGKIIFYDAVIIIIVATSAADVLVVARVVALYSSFV